MNFRRKATFATLGAARGLLPSGLAVVARGASCWHRAPTGRRATRSSTHEFRILVPLRAFPQSQPRPHVRILNSDSVVLWPLSLNGSDVAASAAVIIAPRHSRAWSSAKALAREGGPGGTARGRGSRGRRAGCVQPWLGFCSVENSNVSFSGAHKPRTWDDGDNTRVGQAPSSAVGRNEVEWKVDSA